ncbi:MAG: potassium channel protein [Dehalococcoidales bacterium]|nr:potassium channel protein [Dehalococcoidales bacterium]
MSSLRKVIIGIIVLIAITFAGTIGYMVIEGWSFLDSIYMTITTITTVGYEEIHPLSDNGQIFSIFLILTGMGGAFYALTGVITYIVEGNIAATLGRRRMENNIAKLKSHFILCGYGRVGEEIANILKEEEIPFVIIDNRPECIARADQAGLLHVEGDATSDEILKAAGIDHARGLITALGSDVDNTYITLSARGLYPSLFITARASDATTEAKLKRIGADRVVSPNSIGARRMAMLALRPTVMDFLDSITRRRGPELQIENVAIAATSTLDGQSIDEIKKVSRAIILAVNKKTGRLVPNPVGEEKVVAGDSLIVIGTSDQLTSLEVICEGTKKD